MIDLPIKINPLILLFLIVWTYAWKGVALWKAARKSHKKWFITILILNTFAILEIIYLFIFSKRKRSKPDVEHRTNLKQI